MFFKPSELFSSKNRKGLLGISEMTARRLQKRGLFPKPVRLSPGRNGYLQSDIEEWIAGRPKAA